MSSTSPSPPVEPQGAGFQHRTLVLGSAFLVPGTLLLLSFLSLSLAVAKAGFENPHDNWIGYAGHFIALGLLTLLGNAAYLLAVGSMALGAGAIVREGLPSPHVRILGIGLITIGSTVLLSYFGGGGGSFDGGGLVGRGLGALLGITFGGAGGFIVATAAIIIGLVMAVDAPISTLWAVFADKARLLNDILPTPAARIPTPPAAHPDRTEHPARPVQTYAVHEENSMKPWFQRMPDESQPVPDHKAEALHDTIAPHKPVDQPSYSNPAGELAAALESLTVKLNSRHRPVARHAAAPVMAPPKQGANFEGFFADNGERFIFGNDRGVLHADARRTDIGSGPLLRPLNMEIVGLDLRNVRHESSSVAVEEYSADILEAPVTTVDRVDDQGADLPQNLEAESERINLSNHAIAEAPKVPEYAEDDTVDPAEERFEDHEAESALEHDPDAGDETDWEEEAPKPARRLESGVPAVTVKGRYALSLEILNMSTRDPLAQSDTTRETEATKVRLEKVLQEYGIQAKVVGQQRGPIITLFEVKLDPGVRVAKIAGHYDEIKMNLETPSLRIVAPIPGRATIGIEIPNKNRDTVLLGDLARRDPGFFSKNRELSIVLGKDISGANVYIDLARLPHLLIAGATGAGKSVYLNSVIASLLYTRSPEDMRIIMIDPKMVELNLYEGIPHLLMPVITDVSKAGRALAWVVDEMERRYAFLSAERCRDIRSFNARIQPGLFSSGGLQKMPYIVVCIDELSDLMLVAAREVETYIMRLSQKARAVGIHMIMATQRPSVDVISAIIKANAPARIAFHVAQKTDSRTILEAHGAETLLDRGDMLYKSPSSTTLSRFHAPLITEVEIEKIVAETRRFGKPEYVELPGSDEGGEFEDDEGDVDPALFQEAWELVLESGKTSTSYLQRRLKIGYNRAANIIEMMEAKGYLGPALGNKPREILKRS